MKPVKGLALMAFVYLLSFRPALAYIDPATGSMAMQVILGGIAASYLFLRTHIHTVARKIKSFITPNK